MTGSVERVSESVEGTPVLARVPGAFVVCLLEDTGRFDRGRRSSFCPSSSGSRLRCGGSRRCWRGCRGCEGLL